ncbi:WD40-repeat-containing domain protein [Glomus cerebriforme]|uniref:WD40-repeat-containing domain protein n=1 Tax=Glomus cerebriforme TaxID=658196 RepID=A0A397T165_9GLOM|nr:WD40-repeat-containing domain protein [Glomus cerebriforme]
MSLQFISFVEKPKAHKSPIWSVRWSPSGNVVASGGLDNEIKIWDAETGDYYRTLEGHILAVTGLDINPTGEVLISISFDNTIKRWGVLEGILINDIETKPGEVCCGQYSKDGNYFATASQHGTIDLRNDSNLEEIVATYTSEGKYGLCCRFSPDNKILALSTDNDKIYLFDVETAKIVHKLTGHSGNPIRSLDFTPDGKHLISGSDDETINIYDVKHGNQISKCTGHEGYVMCVAAASDNKHFVSGSTDCKIKLWQLPEKNEKTQVVDTIEEHKEAVSCISWNPDGDKFVVGTDNLLLKWYCVAK